VINKDLIPYLKERLKQHGRADTWVSTRLQRKEVKEIVRLLEEGERLRDELVEAVDSSGACCLIEGRCEHGEAGFA